MGRIPNSGSHPKKKVPHFERKRERHRYADCKYRSKVQYLYLKIRSLIKKKTAKDGLLDNALGLIQNLENKFHQAFGSDYMENCRQEFLSFLVKEELLWKKEKDVNKWWSSVEDLLRKTQPVDLSVNESTITMDNVVIDKNQRCNQNDKSSTRPYPRSLIRSKKQKNKNNFKCGKCSCAANECESVLQSSNDGFERDINISYEKEANLTSTAWNAPDVAFFSPVVSLSKVPETLTCEKTGLENNEVCDTEVALGISRIPVPIKNVMADTLEHTETHPFYLGRSYVDL